MTIEYEKLKSRDFGAVEQRYAARDSILYALSVGLAQDPLDPRQLRFVYEDDLVALPTMAVVLVYPGFWLKEPDTGVDWRKVLHGEQWLTIHAPLPASGAIIGATRVVEIVDKGPTKGAVIYTSRQIADRVTGKLLATVMQSAVCRGDGGFGGPREWTQVPQSVVPPERAPDDRVSLSTRAEAALLYRLNGDLNPLHADPQVAASAGFLRPILHGLATYGVAGHAVLQACCDYDAPRLRRLDCRFAAPVYPGETIVTDIWKLDSRQLAFRCSVPERNIVVLTNGYAEVL